MKSGFPASHTRFGSVIRVAVIAITGLAVAAGFTGCGTNPYQVKVNTTNNPEVKKPALSYKVMNANPDQDETSLRYQEATRFVRTALSGKGMYEAPNPEAADLVIELDYGMKGPLPRQGYVHPTQIGGVPAGVLGLPGSTRYGPPIFSADRPFLYTDVVYEKYLTMRARENKSSKEGAPPRSLWSVEVSTTDESDDLRKYVPIMASVGMDYIGTDTGGERTVKIDGQNDAVMFVKRGM